MLVEGLLQTETYEGLQKKMESLSFKRLAPNRRKDGSEEKAAYVKAVREEVKKLIQDLKDQYYYQNIEGMLEDLAVCHPAVRVLAELVELFAARFREAKESQNLIDFSDMSSMRFDPDGKRRRKICGLRPLQRSTNSSLGRS